jgi:hypothetical protein
MVWHFAYPGQTMMARLLMLVLFCAAGVWADESILPEAYLQRLTAIDAALSAGNGKQANILCSALSGLAVTWTQGALPVDPTIATLVQKSAFAAARMRIHAVLNALSVPAVKATSPADAQALASIAQSEADKMLKLRSGGSIASMPTVGPEIPTTWQQRGEDVLESIRDALGKFFHWLLKWIIGEHSNQGDSGNGSMVVPLALMVVGMILVLIGVMAISAWRTKQPVVLQVVNSSSQPTQDADPRSRAVDEWLDYAQRLAAAGRHREATRAWYHALLVQCWSHGLMHHRIGKTNWEYALALPTAVAWRKQFHDLTRRYDRIWYGGQADAEAVGEFAHEAGAILASVRQRPLEQV